MRRRAFKVPEIPPGVIFSVVVIVIAALVLILFKSGWPQGLMARLQGGPEDAAIEARLAVLRQGRAPQAAPVSHADALMACSEAQDFAVRVAQRDNLEDAALATREMRRVCQPYFDSATGRSPGLQTDHPTDPG
ncbi:hypothetical protein [Brevundimonas goettingensis]|uniref:Uncharacterized protein n=1 Tax=Brevundimonas goettingensis TaxID=2774190 RepID=A0A975GWI1_9CAUL|nr:hypothetical protein [Brevundimonas goettingensis]QTC91868.1 hypothetical protein IFJ75_02760 [Brevundimonas goettingensis]